MTKRPYKIIGSSSVSSIGRTYSYDKIYEYLKKNGPKTKIEILHSIDMPKRTMEDSLVRLVRRHMVEKFTCDSCHVGLMWRAMR